MNTLYISDLDGTLLNSCAELSDYTKKSLSQLIDRGVLFTVATARTKATVKDIFSGVGLNLPFILMNGVLIYDPIKDENITSNEIDSEDVNSVLSAYIKFGKTPMLYILRKDHLEIQYKSIDNIYQEEYIAARNSLRDKRFKKCDSEFEFSDEDKVIYMVSLDKEDVLAPICNEIRAEDRVYCAFYSDNYTDCNFMECMNKKVSKGVAAAQLKALLNIDKIVAFGDNLNDLPLFYVADESYAVSNACEQLKEVATGVIDSNDNDGVVKFIIDRIK